MTIIVFWEIDWSKMFGVIVVCQLVFGFMFIFCLNSILVNMGYSTPGGKCNGTVEGGSKGLSR